MIGFYDYTVWLTYLSLLSAGTGIYLSLAGEGHPFWGVFCLLLSGLCDAFDGKVAHTKQDRTPMQSGFGIQIDSLADVVAFGILPACIGAALVRRSTMLHDFFDHYGGQWQGILLRILIYGLLLWYALAAMIRLAYYNVTEEERQKTEGGIRTWYVGLPVSAVAVVFPVVTAAQLAFSIDLAWLYLLLTAVCGFAFVAKIQVRKPTLKGSLLLVAIGVLEFALMALFRWIVNR